MQGNICKKVKLCYVVFRKRRYEIVIFVVKEWDYVIEMSIIKIRVQRFMYYMENKKSCCKNLGKYVYYIQCFKVLLEI